MPLRYLDDSGYSQGMVRDGASLAIPNGGTYDQLNMLNDQPGILRQRGPTTALVSGAQTAFATSLGFCYSQDVTLIEELYGFDGKTGKIYSINKSTGAATSIGTASPGTEIVGRPVRHFGFLVFPVASTTAVSFNARSVAGQTSSATFTSTAASSLFTLIKTGDPRVPLSGADTTTNVKVGAIVSATNGSTATYTGRVVSIDSSTQFTVWPTPTTGIAPGPGQLTTSPWSNFVGGAGRCVTSFQNRLLFGNVLDMSAYNTTGSIIRNDRRVNYSPLPTETSTLGGSVATGAISQQTAVWPLLNYFEIPGADPIVAMEPISDGELLILTNTSVIIFQGNLVTELATTNPSITYDVYPLGVTEGCASDMSVQRTPVGIMWAGAEGVFAYWPPLRRSPAKTGVRNLCEGKILKYWLSLSSRSDFAIHGSAYTRNHYIVSGFANGATFSLMVNLAGNEWTRLSGAGTDIFNGVRRPTNPAQSFALRWWDQTGAAPSMTNGQTVRLESMIDQYTAGSTKLDSDGAGVAISVTTRPIGGDLETQKIFQRGTTRYQAEMDTAAISVTGQSKIDASDNEAASQRTLGTLSSTAVRTITNATNANPIVVTTSAVHGLQDEDFVNIDGVVGNTNANGRWRIDVTSTTAFSLIGGIGNAAYSSGGQVQKLTESDFAFSALNMGQAATLTMSSTATVKNFELHGVRIATLERAPVMSS